MIRNADVPAFAEIETQLQRHRSSLLPPIPNGINAVNIAGVWGQSWNGRRMLVHLNNQIGVAVFSTPRQLRVLQVCPELLIDGTFRTAPAPYSQIISVHARFNDWVLPVAMCFSTGKLQAQYRDILAALKREVLAVTGQQLQCTSVITDFEASLIRAIRVEIPQARTIGCFYHFCKSLYRKVQELGLHAQYQADLRLKYCIRKFMALGFLPLNTVRQAFA